MVPTRESPSPSFILSFPSSAFFFFTVSRSSDIRLLWLHLPNMFGLLVTYFFILLLRTVSSQTVSLQYVDAYKNQRVCAGACQAVNIGSTPDLIAEAASCNINPIENSCFCKVDLQASVENHISTCVAKMCSNTNDAVTATSIYNDYCSSAGFVKAVATTGMPIS